MYGRLLRRARREEGAVIVTAIFLLTTMMMVGVAALANVDGQTGQSRSERVRESTFNLTEGSLSAQTFVLGRLGTGTDQKEFPEACTPASTDALCPNAAEIARAFDGATQKDFEAGIGWETRVRDNTTGEFYDDAAVLSPGVARWDSNGDRRMWVRAEGRLRGRTRVIAALVKVEDRQVQFPGYSITSGWFQTTNNGRKTIVQSTGSLGVTVRCTEEGDPDPRSGCLAYDPTKGQLAPPGNYQTQYGQSSAVLPDELQALEDAARASGTYYATCPANPNGAIVIVESGDCSYTNSAPAAPGARWCCNTPEKPGLLVIKQGTLKLGGSIEFYGLVYMPNLDNRPGVVVSIEGNAGIIGGVSVDGGGGVKAGSNGAVGQNGANVVFDPRAFNDIRTAGTAGVVQNTWREIVP
jgi:hypothetical protein